MAPNNTCEFIWKIVIHGPKPDEFKGFVSDGHSSCELIELGVMDCNMPYECIRCGVMDGPFHLEITEFGVMDVHFPYAFIGFGVMDDNCPYEFIGFGRLPNPSSLGLGGWSLMSSPKLSTFHRFQVLLEAIAEPLGKPQVMSQHVMAQNRE